MADNLALLEYKTIDEVMQIILILTKMLSVSGMQVYQNLSHAKIVGDEDTAMEYIWVEDVDDVAMDVVSGCKCSVLRLLADIGRVFGYVGYDGGSTSGSTSFRPYQSFDCTRGCILAKRSSKEDF